MLVNDKNYTFAQASVGNYVGKPVDKLRGSSEVQSCIPLRSQVRWRLAY